MSIEDLGETKNTEGIDLNPSEDSVSSVEKISIERDSVSKRLVRKVFPVALALGLMTGCSGCNATDDAKQSEPNESDFEEILEEGINIDAEIESVGIDEAGKGHINTVESEEQKFYYENYVFNISENVFKKIDSYSEVYEVYAPKVEDNKPVVEAFVNVLGRQNLEYIKQPQPAFNTTEYANHIWQGGGEYISYDSADDLLAIELNTPVYIPGITINPASEESVLEGLSSLSERYFSEDFKYEINSMVKENSVYRIKFNRTLNGLPILMETGDLELVISQDGGLLGGTFLLANFEKTDSVKAQTSNEINKNIRDSNASKRVLFRFSDSQEQYERFGEGFYKETGLESARVDLQSVQLGYNYRNKLQKNIAPVFILSGSGDIDIENEPMSANFTVFINAESLEIK